MFRCNDVPLRSYSIVVHQVEMSDAGPDHPRWRDKGSSKLSPTGLNALFSIERSGE
jgi:hypothetical protein